MTDKAASETALGDLHGKVARVMANALTTVELAQDMFIDDPEAFKDDDGHIKDLPTVSAPLLTVITKFLADNKISCVPAESAAVSELEQRLKAKRRRVGNVVHLNEEE